MYKSNKTIYVIDKSDQEDEIEPQWMKDICGIDVNDSFDKVKNNRRKGKDVRTFSLHVKNRYQDDLI